MIIIGGKLPVVLGPHIGVALQQKTANFKFASRAMQWSALTERKKINHLAASK
jgi:hypothetical protein